MITDCYAYDGRGRMTRDMTKGVTAVTYNCLDLPSKVTFQDGNTVSYSYSADGALLRAVYTTGLTPLFLAGAQPSPRSLYLGVTREYCGGRVYENGELRYGLFDGGYYTMPSPADTFSLHLLVRDYRGDVRLVVDEGGGMEEATDYYPYGMPFHSHLSPVQPWKTCGKELDSRFGLHWLDFGARRYDFSKSQWLTPDPLADHSYTRSPYAYCGADPVNYVDPDGRSTWVINLGDGKYQVVGGNLNDKDKNIYVGSLNNKKEFVRGNSIGITTSMTSFYKSDAKGGGRWSIGSIIDTNDKSGDKFLEKIISNNPPMIDDYMMNARNNNPYDFKVTNGTNSPIEGIDVYRGMPVGKNGKGQIIYTSARDIGNIAAGYVAGVNGMSWEASRIAFDFYHGGNEGKSTRDAERYGWIMGYNNANFNNQMDNLLRSVGSSIKSLWNYFVK